MGDQLYGQWLSASTSEANWRNAAKYAVTDEQRKECLNRAAEYAATASKLRKQLDERTHGRPE